MAQTQTMLLSRVCTPSALYSDYVAGAEASLKARRGVLGARQQSSLGASTSSSLLPETRGIQLTLASRPRRAFPPFHNSQRKDLPMKIHCVAEDASAKFAAEPSAAAPAEDKPAPKAAVGVTKKAPFTMKKGQIVRVDKEKYLNSIEYYALAHPKFFRGIDYIYEDRGEILDLRNFEAGEYALITWAGIPTAPAWLPTYMLIKSEKLSYKRM